MESYELWIEKLSQFLAQYRWLLDAYIIEFFTEAHWSKLPASWQMILRGSEIAQVSQLLLSSPFRSKEITVDKVYPLSLLAFVASAHALLISRQPLPQRRNEESVPTSKSRGAELRGRTMGPQVAGLDHVFRRHVKPKKQHEIVNLTEEVMEIVEVTGCKNIIDVGSGQGHLARYLAYHCGLNVLTVDAVGCHLVAAAKFDCEVERDLVKKAKKLKPHESNCGHISHVESIIQPEVSMEDLQSQLGLGFQLPDHSRCESQYHNTVPKDTPYILVGLHTCGDLGPTMLRVYAQSERVVGLLSVGCCYMKLNCPSVRESGTMSQLPSSEDLLPNSIDAKTNCCSSRDRRATKPSPASKGKMWGYPMSHCLLELPLSHTQLSYEAREVACHSVDTYRQRLVGTIEPEKDFVYYNVYCDGSHHVKVHCHRAVVETILRKYGMRRSQVKISRKISRLPFTEYASTVLKGLDLPLFELETGSESIEALLYQWKEVAVFFMLRLVLAPCVETALMLDRLLFLMEQGFNAQLLAVFDAELSPRNLLITSHK